MQPDIAQLMSEIDTTTASVARMYDNLLGGTQNFEVDRVACGLLQDVVPVGPLARNNRRWVRRSTRILAQDLGLDQFVDFGTGLPTEGNVHEVVAKIAPDAKVVYVDNDPIVARHGQGLLGGQNGTIFLHADFRYPETVLRNPETRRLIDFDRPVAALFNSVLHCVKDEEDPYGLVGRAMDALPPGSMLVISHLASEDAKVRQEATNLMLEVTKGNWGRVRTPQEITRFFDGFELLDPLGNIIDWRPDGTDEEQTNEWIEFGGVATKTLSMPR